MAARLQEVEILLRNMPAIIDLHYPEVANVARYAHKLSGKWSQLAALRAALDREYRRRAVGEDQFERYGDIYFNDAEAHLIRWRRAQWC